MAISSLVHRDPYFRFHRPVGLRRAVRTARPSAGFRPVLDAVETEKEYRITAELPGLAEDDFKLVIEEGVLTLEGEKKSRHESGEDAEEARGFRRVESRSGRFARRLRFGAEVDEDAVEASYRNGLLEVVVPKVIEERRVRTVPVTSA